MAWLGGAAFNGCLLFDECHRAKNLVPPPGGSPTATGVAVAALQAALPHARVVYCRHVTRRDDDAPLYDR